MTQAISHRKLDPGTTGWTIDDFHEMDDLGQLSDERLEIVDGVLTRMAAQGFQSIDPLNELRGLLEGHLKAAGKKGRFCHEVDIQLRKSRVARPDMFFLSAELKREQKRITEQRGLSRGKYRPLYVIPELIVESLSEGHEDHDRITKVEWYAQAQVPYYWLLTAHELSLVCLVYKDGQYFEEARGVGDETIKSSAFGGVSIPLSALWDAA